MKLIHCNFIAAAVIASCVFFANSALSNTDTQLMIIVNDSTEIESISQRQLRKLFLGKSLKLPNGSRAVLGTYKPLRNVFNKKALGRSSAQVDAAWSRLKFSGRAKQPQAFESPEDVVAFVQATPNAIAYLPDGTLTTGVRSVLQVR